jgi:hypothetical protein
MSATETDADVLRRIETKLDAALAEIESFKASTASFLAGPGSKLLKLFGGGG